MFPGAIIDRVSSFLLVLTNFSFWRGGGGGGAGALAGLLFYDV